MTTNRWPQRFYRFVPGTPPPIPAGTYNVGVGQTYPSLTEAAADLNYRGIAGPVTLLLTDAVYDSSAAEGNIFPIVFAKIAGVSPTNTITVLPAGARRRSGRVAPRTASAATSRWRARSARPTSRSSPWSAPTTSRCAG